jgi:hypothetical protein
MKLRGENRTGPERDAIKAKSFPDIQMLSKVRSELTRCVLTRKLFKRWVMEPARSESNAECRQKGRFCQTLVGPNRT